MLSRFLLLGVLFNISCFLQAQNRPQEPKPPFSYGIEQVSFINNHDNVKLEGTLTLPSLGARFPAVILISGSGAQNRDAEIFGHKSFWLMADFFTKHNIAVLRVDDRGAGASGGDHNSAHLDDFAKDVEAAMAFLQHHKNIDKNRIGLLGHSLGGVVGPIVASRNPDIDFLVMLAGAGVRGKELMLIQKAQIERKSGVPEMGIKIGQKNIGGAYDIIIDSDHEGDSLKQEVKNYLAQAFGSNLPEVQLNMISQQLTTPWLADFIRYDPKEYLPKVKCPILAYNGSNDLQVTPKENLEGIRSILIENGHPDFTIKEFPKLNHLFQESETGLPNEYGIIEQTFSPEVLILIKDWILEKTN